MFPVNSLCAIFLFSEVNFNMGVRIISRGGKASKIKTEVTRIRGPGIKVTRADTGEVLADTTSKSGRKAKRPKAPRKSRIDVKGAQISEYIEDTYGGKKEFMKAKGIKSNKQAKRLMAEEAKEAKYQAKRASYEKKYDQYLIDTGRSPKYGTQPDPYAKKQTVKAPAPQTKQAAPQKEPPTQKPTVTPVTKSTPAAAAPPAAAQAPDPKKALFDAAKERSGGMMSTEKGPIYVPANKAVTPVRKESDLDKFEKKVEAQRSRQAKEDAGTRRVRELARAMTGGKSTGVQGYEQRSWAGKFAENVLTGVMSAPQNLGRGLAIAGEKIVLTAEAITKKETRPEVGREYTRAVTDPTLKRTFDITTPEGATTYTMAATGAVLPAAGAVLKSRGAQGYTVTGRQSSTTTAKGSTVTTRTTSQGTITPAKGGAPKSFVRTSILRESGKTGKATYESTTKVGGKTYQETGSGSTFRSQIPEMQQTGGGTLTVKGAGGKSTPVTWTTQKGGGTVGGMGKSGGSSGTVGRVGYTSGPAGFRGFLGAQKGSNFVTQVAEAAVGGLKLTFAKFTGTRGTAGTTGFSRGTGGTGGAGGTGGSGAISRGSPSVPRAPTTAAPVRSGGLGMNVESALASQYYTGFGGVRGVGTSFVTAGGTNNQLVNNNLEYGSATAPRPASIPRGPSVPREPLKPIITPLPSELDEAPSKTVVPTEPIISSYSFGGGGGARSGDDPADDVSPEPDVPTDTTPTPDIGGDVFVSTSAKTQPLDQTMPAPYVPFRSTTGLGGGAFGAWGNMYMPSGGGGFGSKMTGGWGKPPKGYTPSLYAAFGDIKSSEEPDEKLLRSGLSIRPIVTKGKRRKLKGFFE